MINVSDNLFDEYINNIINSINVRFACVVNNVASSMKIDYSGADIDKSKDNQWIVFPWENN